MSIRRSLLFIPLIAAVALSGCWYYSTSGSSLPPHIKTVAVPLAENETLEFGIENILTDAVADAFIADNALRVVDQQAADSQIEVKIVDVRDEPLTYTAEETGETAQEYRISIQVEVRYLDLKKDKPLWEENRLEGWGTYAAPGEPEQRTEGMKEAAEMIAAEILQRSVAGW